MSTAKAGIIATILVVMVASIVGTLVFSTGSKSSPPTDGKAERKDDDRLRNLEARVRLTNELEAQIQRFDKLQAHLKAELARKPVGAHELEAQTNRLNELNAKIRAEVDLKKKLVDELEKLPK